MRCNIAQKVSSIIAEIGLDSSKFTSGANNLGGSINGLINKLGGLNVGLTAAVAAFGLAVDWMGEAEKAAVASNIETAKLEAILRATGYAANMTSPEVLALADSLSRLSGLDDEVIVSAESMMLTFKNIGREEFPRAMQAALDLSTTFGGLDASSKQLGMALNDPISGITRLTRSGVQFTDKQKDMIRGFVETNQLAQAQNIILQEVEKQVGGTAKAMEEASDGANRAKNAYENYREEVGKNLIPVVRQWNDLLARTWDSMRQGEEEASRYDEAVRSVAAAHGIEVDALKYRMEASRQFRDQFNEEVRAQMNASQTSDLVASKMRDLGYVFEDGQWQINGHADALQEDTDAMTEMVDSYMKGIDRLQSIESNYTEDYAREYATRTELDNEYLRLKEQGYSDQSSQIQGIISQMAEVDAAIQKTKDEHKKQTDSMIIDMVTQTLAIDGLTKEEGLSILQLQVDAGLLTADVIKQYDSMMAAADRLIAKRRQAEYDNTVTINMNYVERHITAGDSGRTYPLAGGKAGGGPASGYTLVGEQGPEIVRLPSGSYVNNNNATNNMLKSGDGAYRTDPALIDAMESLNASLKLLPNTVARAIRQNEKYTK